MKRSALCARLLCVLAMAVLAAASRARPALLQQARRARALQQAPCAPGFYLSGGVCTRCGYGYWCAGGTAPRVACNMFLGTANDTASSKDACGPVTCNPCVAELPDVLLTTGKNADPANGLWRISGFTVDPSAVLIPDFLCGIESTAGAMVADVAVLYTGDVLFVDTDCNLRYLPTAAYDLLAATDDFTLKCGTQFLAALRVPFATTCTGLSVGFRSNLVFVSTDMGNVITIEFTVDPVTGGLSNRMKSFTTVTPDPYSDRNKSTGGTDMTPGPDGNMYRWIAQDIASSYAGTRLGVQAGTGYLSGTFTWTDRQIAPVAASGVGQDKSFANAGAFCTATGVFGAAATNPKSGGTQANFFSFGLGRPNNNGDLTKLRPMALVASSAIITQTNGLRVNGASAVKPFCGGPELIPLVSTLSLQVKAPDCVATPRPLPLLTLTRRQPVPSATICQIQNIRAVSDKDSFISPPPPTSVCSSFMPVDPAAIYAVEAPATYANLSLAGVTCYASLGNSTVAISNPDGTFNTPAATTPVTCVAEYAPTNDAALLPGYYRPTPGSPVCSECGKGYACPGNNTRTPCDPKFFGTRGNTSATCTPLGCDPCWETNPTVFFTVGPNGDPRNGLYAIRNWSASADLVPELLCELKNLNGPGVGDITLLHTGELLVIDIAGSIWSIAAAQVASMLDQSNPSSSRACPLTSMSLRLPSIAGGYTGLSTSYTSNIIFASSSEGDVYTIAVSQDPFTGVLSSAVVSKRLVPCDPVAYDANNELTGSPGGTDLTPGRDGAIHRVCAKADQGVKYTGTTLFMTNDSSALNYTFGYTERDVVGPTGAPTTASNAGAFCTRELIVGTGYSLAEEKALFFSFGANTSSVVKEAPWTMPPAVQVASTIVKANLRINGASNLPKCWL